MFFPLVPSRFSAPQLIPDPGSPWPEFAAPYEIVTCSLAGVVPTWIQISPVWVLAFEKFFTAAQSMMTQLFTWSVRRPIRIAPPPAAAGLRSFQNGATTLFGLAALGNVCGAKI